MTFATQLKQARQAAGLTQQQVADLCGVGVQAVKNWEAGRRSPPKHPVHTQAEILGLIAAEAHPESTGLTRPLP